MNCFFDLNQPKSFNSSLFFKGSLTGLQLRRIFLVLSHEYWHQMCIVVDIEVSFRQKDNFFITGLILTATASYDLQWCFFLKKEHLNLSAYIKGTLIKLSPLLLVPTMLNSNFNWGFSIFAKI